MDSEMISDILKYFKNDMTKLFYEIEPSVWGRVGPDPRLQPQVDKARGLGRPGAASHF